MRPAVSPEMPVDTGCALVADPALFDPVFVPQGERRTTAEMSAEEKDAISHRGQAFRALAPLVAELL